MNKFGTRLTALVLATVLVVSLIAGCDNNVTVPASSQASSQASSEAKPLDPYTVVGFFPGDTPIDFQMVLDAAEEQMKDTINVELDLNFIPWSDYGDKIKVKMSAGDDFDLHLNAPWLHMYQMIADEAIQAWDPYLEEFGPAVFEAFAEKTIEANRFDGKIMGIPLGPVVAGPKMLPIRKDLREKYQLEKPDTLDEFEVYLRKVKENEPGMYPMTWVASNNVLGEHTMLNYINWGQNNAAVYVHFDEEGKALPVKPIYEDEQFLKWCRYAYKWHQEGLIQNDVMAQKDEKGAFISGKTACANVDTFDEASLQANVPTGTIEVIYFTGEPGQSKFISDFKMWNFLCLSTNSKDPERVTMFFNWIYEDQANYDLLQYGIKDKHWVDSGDLTYDLPEGVNAGTNYNFPGYVLLQTPKFDRLNAQGSEDYLTDNAFRKDEDNFIASELIGFTPDYSNVESEMAKVGAIWAETIFLIGAGVMDVDAELPNIKEKLQAAGYDKIYEEAKKQVEDFIAGN